MKYKLTLQWWLMVCVLTLGMVYAYYTGVIPEIYLMDTTYICIIIACLLVYSTVKCGLTSVTIERLHHTFQGNKRGMKSHPETHMWVFKSMHDDDLEIKLSMDRCSFISMLCSSLGMFGTMWGMILMLKAIQSMDVKNMDFQAFSAGMGVALYTTLVGLFARMLIRIQVQALNERMQRVDNDIQTCR